ncbi:unnamed protein product [Rhizophagus irregularis]|nr:unnamed protein product [Rhizophagus irregularis]
MNNWDEPHTVPQQIQNQGPSNVQMGKRMEELEKQVQLLSKNIKILQDNKAITDQSIADIHHHNNIIDTSLADVNLRLNKYDTIIQQLTININLLSKKEIASTQERPRKISKKVTPYDQSSYRATKSKYNLRNSKESNYSAEDSEAIPATEEDTDIPDDTAMSDGAVFEGIIEDSLNNPPNKEAFVVKSYNPLNLLPSFNAKQNINPNRLPNEEHVTNLHVTNQDNDYLIDYIKIGTINIQGGYKRKLPDILNYFVTHNYNILGITETQYQNAHDNKLIERYPHPFNKNSFIYIILDANGHNKGTGVGIIMNDTLYQHVHQVKFHIGRVLNIQLGFKHKHVLNLTCVYLPADRNKQHDDIKLECNTFINDIVTSISNTKSSKTHTIIMGDFNCQPKEKNNLNHHIIQQMKLNGLKDMAKYHATNKVPDITHTTHRIDYIFGNINIIEKSIHTFTQSIPSSHFSTDHKSVIILLQDDLFKPPDIQHRYQNNAKKEKPEYNKMNEESWEEYKEKSNTYFKYRFYNIDFSTITTQDDIDHIWNVFENSIHNIKRQIIPHKQIKTSQQHNLYPLHIRQLNNHVISIYKTKQFFNLKHIYIRNKIEIPKNKENIITDIPDSIWTTYFSNWSTYHNHITKIATKIDHQILLRYNITKENYTSQKTEIYNFYKYLKYIRDEEISKWRTERIDYYLNERNNDLTDNQTKMINSILQRTPRKITLDRLIYQDKNDNTIFTNNPDIIKSEAIKHFQNIGKHEDDSLYRSHNDLPNPWKDIYDPCITNINPANWSLLQQTITIDDIKSALKKAPSNKAPGPSQITYEDLKHLHDNVLKLLIQIYNKCIELDTIPKSWHLIIP